MSAMASEIRRALAPAAMAAARAPLRAGGAKVMDQG